MDDYRNKLYEMISAKKTNVRRIQHEKTTRSVSSESILQLRDLFQIERPLMTKTAVSSVSKNQERAAPIAQAECSDTDWESARTNVRGNSIEKNGTSSSLEGNGGTLRG